jgi:nucleoside-diphosphate-sugar epimerase
MTDTQGIQVVFGASGGLGNAVVRELAAQGKRVRGVTRSGKANVPPSVEIVRGDATDPVVTTSVCAGAAVVYNCANAPYTNWPTELPPIMHGTIGGAAAGAKLVFGDNLYSYGPVHGPLIKDLAETASGHKGRTRIHMAQMLMEAHGAGKVRATIGRASDFFGPASPPPPSATASSRPRSSASPTRLSAN